MSYTTTEDQPVPEENAAHERFTKLPERVKPEEMVTSQPVDPPRDPDGGRDPERDFMLRHIT